MFFSFLKAAVMSTPLQSFLLWSVELILTCISSLPFYWTWLNIFIVICLLSPNQQQHSNKIPYPKLFMCALYCPMHVNFKPIYFVWTQDLSNSISSVPTKSSKICCAFLLYLHLAIIMCNLCTSQNYSRKRICSGE